MNNKAVASGGTSIFAGGDMNRSASELAMEELFKHAIDEEIDDNRDDREVWASAIPNQRAGVFADTDGFFGVEDDDKSFADVYSGDLTFPFRNREIMNGFLSCDGLTGTPFWSPNLASKHSSISVTMDSQTSICVGSPTSATISKVRDSQATGATSGSSHEQSDDDDIETEGGQCEQSTDHVDVKLIKRKVSNRESARRSRRKKQAHLADLEKQVEQLQAENSSLFKNLTDATQQFEDSTTNNRVLKSDVEALRAKVKLAEDMVARGSLTFSLSHFLQTHLNTPQSFSSHNVCRVGNVSPTVTVRGDDTSYPGLTVNNWRNSTLGLEHVDNLTGNMKNGIMSEPVSCASEMWQWEAHVPTVSK